MPAINIKLSGWPSRAHIKALEEGAESGKPVEVVLENDAGAEDELCEVIRQEIFQTLESLGCQAPNVHT